MGQPTSFKVSIEKKISKTQRRYIFSPLVSYFLFSVFCAEIALMRLLMATSTKESDDEEKKLNSSFITHIWIHI